MTSGMRREGQLPIRDLKLIDGTMAELAEVMGLTISDYDTVDAAEPEPSGAVRATAALSEYR